MQINYTKLWKLLDSKKISRKKFRNDTKISSSTYTKLVNNKNISTSSLVMICEYLDCDLSDIAQISKKNNFGGGVNEIHR